MGARDAIVDSQRLSGSLYVFLSDVIYTQTYCEASRKACVLSELRSLILLLLLLLLIIVIIIMIKQVTKLQYHYGIKDCNAYSANI